MSELEANNNGIQETEANETTETTDQNDTNAELAKLKAEFAKQKAALDKATKEAGDYKKQLRAKQSQEEIDAEDRKQREEANQRELEELRKRFAVMETTKSVMAKFGSDEAVSAKIGEYLFGAADVDGALTELQKMWTAKEKALRLEFGKIPAPGVGSSDGPTISKEQLDSMGYKDRLEFAQKHPDEYNKLMGR